MSTRCQVAIIDRNTDPNRPVLFYRHADGYPEGVQETLDAFCDLVNSGKIRGNSTQAAGWLLFLGMREYLEDHYLPLTPERLNSSKEARQARMKDVRFLDHEPHHWKIGAYEPTDKVHGDIEYLHIVYLADNMFNVEPEKKPTHWRSFHTSFNSEDGMYAKQAAPSDEMLAGRIRQVLMHEGIELSGMQKGVLPTSDWPKEAYLNEPSAEE